LSYQVLVEPDYWHVGSSVQTLIVTNQSWPTKF